MKRNWIFSLGLLAMAVVILYALLFRNSNTLIQDENVVQKLLTKEEESPKEEEKNGKESIPLSKYGEVLPCEQNIWPIGELINVEAELNTQWNGKKLQVNSIEVAKTFTDTDARAWVEENDGLFGENGEILKPYSYVVVNIMIINPTEEEWMPGLGNIRCVSIDKTTGEPLFLDYKDGILQSELLGYRTLADEETRLRKDYYLYKLQPGEEFTCNLVYILEDTILETTDCYVRVNPSGTMPDFDTMFFKIG